MVVCIAYTTDPLSSVPRHMSGLHWVVRLCMLVFYILCLIALVICRA
jgi:hypothetical protein